MYMYYVHCTYMYIHVPYGARDHSPPQDLLSLSMDGHFESQFFSFRRKVQQLDKQFGQELGAWLQRSPSLQAQLRIMEMFQCSSHREVVRVSIIESLIEGFTHLFLLLPQTILSPQHKAVVAAILTDIQDITRTLTSHISHPPLLPHTPPTASKLLWLHGLEERASGAMSVVRSAAPELLEGELGWKLRQTYTELTDKLQR